MKLAVFDQSFHWPPTGGSWVDVREVCYELQEKGHSVNIFVPVWNRWNIPGGVFKELPGIQVTPVKIRSKQFNFYQLPRIFRNPIEAWNPDTLLLTNSFFLAPYFINTFANIPVFLRVFAYELICPNYMSMSKHNVFKWDEENPTGEICGNSLLNTPFTCWSCGLRNLVRTLIGPKLDAVAAEYWSGLGFSPFYQSTLRSSLDKLNGVIVYNPEIRTLFKALKAPVHVVPGGINTAHFKPSVTNISKNTSSKVKILMSGRIDDPRKGFSVFEKAIDKLLKNNLNIEAYVTNSNSTFSHPIIQSTGWYNFDELPDLYSQMDIVVCPSIWPEPFGLVALESMASEKPVVASYIGGMKYTVADGVTGFHFEPGNSNQLAEKLENLVKQPQLRNDLGKNGRQRIQKYFTWNSVVQRYIEPVLTGSNASVLDWTEDI